MIGYNCNPCQQGNYPIGIIEFKNAGQHIIVPLVEGKSEAASLDSVIVKPI